MPSYKTVITVGNANDKLDLGYTYIEVWASWDEGRTYHEVTSQAVDCAHYLSTDGTGHRVEGLTFGFSIDGAEERRVTFVDPLRPLLEDPNLWSTEEIVAKLNQEFPTLASIKTVGPRKFIDIGSPSTGRASSVSCTYSEDRNVFPLGTVYGRDARILLVRDKLIYPYTDLSGTQGIRYKWRFSKNGSSPISPFSARKMGDLERAQLLPVSIATARFVGNDGTPVEKTVLIVVESSQMIGGMFLAGGTSQLVTTDESGFLQFPLVIGSKVKFAIEGTYFVKEVTVPNAQTFDILTAMSGVDDGFTVQETAPLLTKRSL
jgi:hypothetical protein